MFQAWTEVCYEIFGSLEVQTMWNSPKNGAKFFFFFFFFFFFAQEFQNGNGPSKPMKVNAPEMIDSVNAFLAEELK